MRPGARWKADFDEVLVSHTVAARAHAKARLLWKLLQAVSHANHALTSYVSVLHRSTHFESECQVKSGGRGRRRCLELER
jgi:hypothetical protein